MCGAVTVVPDELGAWLVQQRRWMNSANIMDLRQLFINLSWVNSRMRVFLYIIQLLRWVEFNAGLGICFGKLNFGSPELQHVLLYIARCHCCTNAMSLHQCFCAEVQQLSCCTAEAFVCLTHSLICS
jgi:hypothetical protein